jgi:hypothetical protein
MFEKTDITDRHSASQGVNRSATIGGEKEKHVTQLVIPSWILDLEAI